MILYHMSQTLKLGDEMKPDYQKNMKLVQPFIQALEQSEDCFYGMVLNGKYLYAVLSKFKLWSGLTMQNGQQKALLSSFAKPNFPTAIVG